MTHADVAVIGAGPAGLAASRALRRAGATVCVFDKGRGAGGRLSSRRLESGAVDHGAPFFKATSPSFCQTVARWADSGLCALWPDAGENYWVGTPRMNAPIRAEADEAGVQFATQISKLVRIDGRWELHDAGGNRACIAQRVLITCPAPQAMALLPATSSGLIDTLRGTKAHPIWTAVVQASAQTAPSVIRPEDSAAIELAVFDSRKPGRSTSDLWTVHATEDWSRAHVHATSDMAASALGAELSDILGRCGAGYETRPVFGHRWLYGRQANNLPMPVVSDADAGLYLAGDGFGAGIRDTAVDSAWVSGETVAAKIASEAA